MAKSEDEEGLNSNQVREEDSKQLEDSLIGPRDGMNNEKDLSNLGPHDQHEFEAPSGMDRVNSGSSSTIYEKDVAPSSYFCGCSGER